VDDQLIDEVLQVKRTAPQSPGPGELANQSPFPLRRGTQLPQLNAILAPGENLECSAKEVGVGQGKEFNEGQDEGAGPVVLVRVLPLVPSDPGLAVANVDVEGMLALTGRCQVELELLRRPQGD
jgi:hypothetical protein